MPRTCTVCRHPQRGEIEAALESGQSYRDTSSRFGVSKSALERHRGGHTQRPRKETEGLDRLTPHEQAPTPTQRRYLCSRYKALLIPPCQFEGGVYVASGEREQRVIETSATFLEGCIQVIVETAPQVGGEQ